MYRKIDKYCRNSGSKRIEARELGSVDQRLLTALTRSVWWQARSDSPLLPRGRRHFSGTQPNGETGNWSLDFLCKVSSVLDRVIFLTVFNFLFFKELSSLYDKRRATMEMAETSTVILACFYLPSNSPVTVTFGYIKYLLYSRYIGAFFQKR